MGLEIEKVNLASGCIGAAENQGTAVGRPAWIELVFARGREWLGHARLDRGDVKVPRLAGFPRGVRDLLAVRRPAWNRCNKGRISQLEAFCAISLGPPECAVGIGDVGHPSAIA